MHFTKMQGLGNDYLYVYAPALPPDAAALAVRLSDRHFGVGSDGMIWILPSETADCQMRIFNADGSEARMCGNGIRCVGKYVYEKGYVVKTALTVETLSGIKTLTLSVTDGRVDSVTVDMGAAAVSTPRTLTAAGQAVTVTPVSVGNPHAVVFTADAAAAPLTTLGAALERHEAFPGGVNVEFVQVLSPTALRMRVWERGSGVTLACGTGACASVAAAVAAGYCPPDTPVTVTLDGGDLQVRLTPEGRAIMTGPAAFVCEGEVDTECMPTSITRN